MLWLILLHHTRMLLCTARRYTCWTACLATALVYPLRTQNDPLAQPVIPTGNNIIEQVKKTECNVLMTVPTLLEEMATSDEGVEVLKKLEYVNFGGVPLPLMVGQRLWDAGVQLCSGYGETEFGIPVVVADKPDIADGDWMWMRFPEGKHIRWSPQGDNSYKLRILLVYPKMVLILLFLDESVGRADDVIVLASGEKTVPAPMESIITSSPLVQGVVMFRRERHRVGVLIEPRPGYAVDVNDEKAVAEFRNHICRIFKEFILTMSKDKPTLGAPKGTVIRKVTLKAYDAGINVLYDTVEATSEAPECLVGLPAWTSEVLELGALRNSSDPEIKKAAAHIPLDLLTAHIAALVSDSGAGQGDFIEQHKKAINTMISKYSSVKPALVLLTGPTGGLGSFLLSELLRSSAVLRVFAFNRPSSSKLIMERQKAAFRDRGLELNLLDSDKLVFGPIRNSLTLIIHNAWHLDFNLGISSFEDSIRASRNLIDLGLDSPQKKNLRFLSTSSTGSARGWDNSKCPFPKEAQLDLAVAVGADHRQEYVTSTRIGKIAGRHGGPWATTDWFPIIVKSSIALGALPEAAGEHKRIVAARGSYFCHSGGGLCQRSPTACPRSASSIHSRPWAEIIAFVRHAIITRKAHPDGDDVLPIVSFGQWFVLLESKGESTSEDDLAQIPTTKLLEFFRGIGAGGHGPLRRYHRGGGDDQL
ncbi:putative non-ribosomal peptide synthetase [Boletus coccyginus]|nr:putative non-ribosomal peptide synthetase [Boletus coccyginus]